MRSLQALTSKVSMLFAVSDELETPHASMKPHVRTAAADCSMHETMTAFCGLCNAFLPAMQATCQTLYPCFVSCRVEQAPLQQEQQQQSLQHHQVM